MVIMYNSEISVIDRRSGKIRPQLCLDAEVTLSSKVQHWQGIRVEQQYLPPSETPEMIALDHLICIHQSAPLNLQYKEDDNWHNCLMKPGDIFLIPEGTSHSASWQESGELLILALSPEAIGKIAPEAIARKSIELIPYKGKSDGLIANIALAFKEELQTNGRGGQLYRDCLLNTLVTRLLRDYSVAPVKKRSGGLGKRRLQLVVNYVRVHLNEEIRLTEMAKVAGLSQFHFSRMFKESVGVSPTRYVNQCRIEKAKQMLACQQLSLNQISTACGYSNLSYFVRQFRQYMGVTPKVYRDS